MDLLKKEMEKKKKALALAKKQKENTGGTSRFLKASDLRKVEEAEEERRKRNRTPEVEKAKTEDTDTPLEKKNRVEKNEKTEHENGSNQNDNATSSSGDILKRLQQQNLSALQITGKLRELGLPIRLFGEGNVQERLVRLAKAMEHQRHQLAGLSEMDEFRLGSGHGIRNPFLGGKKEKQEQEDALLTTAGESKSDDKQADDVQDEEDANDPHKRIYRFFKGVLKEWENDLALRPETVKRTAAGKNETKTVKQCKDYIRPLFKLCKTRRLEPSLMSNLIKIVDYCEQGDFVKATDAYMDVAIGRAAWPIGVTMVGIHARTGRSKIESSNVAHVMNSELQRKYLTSVKRLMNYSQKKRTDVAPSKKVMN